MPQLEKRGTEFERLQTSVLIAAYKGDKTIFAFE